MKKWMILFVLALASIGRGAGIVSPMYDPNAIHKYDPNANLGPLTLTGNSAVFQPTTDSTTFLQVLDADGGTPIFSVDSTNERIGIRTLPTAFGIVHVTGITAGGGQAALYFDPDTSGGGAQYGIRVLGDGTGAGQFIPLGLHGSPTFTNMTASIWIGNESGRPGLNIGHSFTVVVPEHGAIIAGNVGLGNETAPETLIELTHDQPYRTIHHKTHENDADGREIITYYKGEKGDGTEFVQFMTKVAHDGSGDDQKSYRDLFINDGDDGDSPTFAMRLNSIGLGVGTKTQASLLEADGALGLAIETVTGNTTLDKTHSTLLVNASGNVTITLPTAASAYNSTDKIGRIYTVKKIDSDSDTVTLDPDGSEEIEFAANAVLTKQGESITFQTNGTAWYIL